MRTQLVWLVFGMVALLAADSLHAQAPRRPGPGGGRAVGTPSQGGPGGGGQQQDAEQAPGKPKDGEFKVPTDPRLVEAYEKFIKDMEKVALDYERTGQSDKAKEVYKDMLRVVPVYSEAQSKLEKIKGKELTAEKKIINLQVNEGWQDTGLDCVEGKPLVIVADGEWTFKLTKKVTPDGIEIPKDLRDFPLGALVGVIVSSDDKENRPFLVGSKLEITAKKSGRLKLCVYDNDPSDNLGRLNVTISGTFATSVGKK